MSAQYDPISLFCQAKLLITVLRRQIAYFDRMHKRFFKVLRDLFTAQVASRRFALRNVNGTT
jgi:hypothetical protein